MERPSGDNVGSNSAQGERVSRVSPVPFAFTDQTSSWLSKTTRPDNELTSDGVHIGVDEGALAVPEGLAAAPIEADGPRLTLAE
jgi:hypothetical protein